MPGCEPAAGWWGGGASGTSATETQMALYRKYSDWSLIIPRIKPYRVPRFGSPVFLLWRFEYLYVPVHLWKKYPDKAAERLSKVPWKKQCQLFTFRENATSAFSLPRRSLQLQLSTITCTKSLTAAPPLPGWSSRQLRHLYLDEAPDSCPTNT